MESNARARVLEDLVADTPLPVSLRRLCGEAETATGASLVEIRLDDEAFPGQPPIAGSAPSSPPADPDTVDVPVVSTTGHPLATMRATWPAGSVPVDPVTTLEGFTRLARLLIERNLVQRERMLMIARERDRIAGQLHDDPIQSMTAVSLQLQRLIARLPDGAERELAATARATTDASIERLRHMLFSLHPTTLEEDGLVAALETYCEGYAEPEGIACTVRSSIDRAVPFGVEALAFRLARGAIENAVKHAECRQLTIDVHTHDAALTMTVVDDGVGFETGGRSRARPGHFGLAHATDLARSAGGSYAVESNPGSGTEVRIELSLV